MHPVWRSLGKSCAPVHRHFSLIFAFFVITYGFLAFNHVNAGDDWQLFQYERWMYEWAVALGRWVSPFVWMILADNKLAPPFTLALMLAALAYAGAIYGGVLRLSSDRAILLLIFAFATAPFWAEVASFEGIQAVRALGLMSGAVSAHLIDELVSRRHRRAGGPGTDAALFILAAVLMGVSAGCFQPLAFIPLLALGFGFMRDVASGRRALRREYATIMWIAGYAAAGLIFYVIGARLSFAFWEVTPPTSGQYSLKLDAIGNPRALMANIGRLFQYNAQFWFGPQHLFPLYGKVLLWISVIIMIGNFSLKLRESGAGEKYGRGTMVMIVLLLLLLLPWSIGLVRTADPYRYNGLVSLSMLIGAIVALAYDAAPAGSRSRFIAGAAGILLVLGFSFHQNVAAATTLQYHRRDYYLMNRILGELEDSDAYRTAEEPLQVVWLGWPEIEKTKAFSTPGSDYAPMNSSIVECGVFNCQPFRMNDLAALLQYGTGDVRFIGISEVESEEGRTRVLEKVRAMEVAPGRYALEHLEDNTFVLAFN